MRQGSGWGRPGKFTERESPLGAGEVGGIHSGAESMGAGSTGVSESPGVGGVASTGTGGHEG